MVFSTFASLLAGRTLLSCSRHFIPHRQSWWVGGSSLHAPSSQSEVLGDLYLSPLRYWLGNSSQLSQGWKT